MSRRRIAVGVVGATGMVGEATLALLAARRFPVGELRVFASPRSEGRVLRYSGRGVRVERLTAERLQGLDFVFFAVNTAMSREWCPVAARAGAVAIDDSSAWRMDPHVPLVIPEVNGKALAGHRGIVAIPNCAITPVAMALAPLHRAVRVRRVVMATYQAVSGYGRSAVEELEAQLRPGRAARARALPRTIAFNVIPQIDAFADEGETKEEQKFELELRKILGDAALRVTGTAVRVPVRVGHCAAVNVEFERPLAVSKARALLARAAGVVVEDDPVRGRYPTPLDVAGTDACYVGRLRRDLSHPRGLNLWVAMDNLRKGAALNSLHIAEALVRSR